MSALAHVGNFEKFSLTSTQERSNHYRVAAKSVTGISLLISQGAPAPIDRCTALFYRPAFARALACQFYGGRYVGAARPAGSLSPVRLTRAVRHLRLASAVADSNELKESTMSYDAQEAPANAARQIAHFFGLIADTLDWNHTAWLALQAKLQAIGKAPEALTLADVKAAISSINADLAEVRQ